jgi:hypothetical protein
MSFVQREIDKLYNLFEGEKYDSPRWREVYAAKQALSWALDPNTVMSPYAMLADKRGDNSVNVEMADTPQPEQPA